MAGVGRTLWPSPEAAHKILMGDMSSLYLEERNILISEVGRTPRGIWMNMPCLNFPQCTTLSSYSFVTFPHNFPLLIKVSMKTLSFNGFFRSSFPCGGSWSHKILVNSHAFLLLIYHLLQSPSREPRRVEGKHFFSPNFIYIYIYISYIEWYILDTSPLSYVCIVNIFSHSVCCLFTPNDILRWIDILNFSMVQFI